MIGGLNKVSNALDHNENAAILSLDIKRYFYNVRVNVKEIVERYIGKENLNDSERRLCELLQKIHEKYESLFNIQNNEAEDNESERKKVMLPIGLPSSGFLGNLYLKPFDDYIRNYVTPAYYGRYVDDILLVFTGKGLKITPNPNTGSNIDGFIKDHLENEPIGSREKGTYLHFIGNRESATSTASSKEKRQAFRGLQDSKTDNDRVSSISYTIETADSTLSIQHEKVIMEYFNCKESKAAINKFKKQLEKNRSEFRYLPWEEEINLEFDDEAFRLEISESINKIRNIEGISEDKYGASKYLAKKIFLSILPFEPTSKDDLEASARQILTYFKGRTTILMNSLWEKVATYFVINNQPKQLEQFWKQANNAIEKIYLDNTKEKEDISPEINERLVRECLREHLKISLSMAIAIVPNILTSCFHNKPEKKEFAIMADNFRKTYLFRHRYQYLKGYCYTLPSDSEDALVCKNLISAKIGAIQMNSYAPYVAPVFLKPHEIILLNIFHNLSNGSLDNLLATESLDEIFRKYNYAWREIFEENFCFKTDIHSKYFKECFKVERLSKRDPNIVVVDIKDERAELNINADKKIGIVNWKIDDKDLKKAICGQPNKSNQRRQLLFEVLNYAAKKHVEMLVFPETSIPVEWLPLLVYQSVKTDCAFIGGLEFYVTPSQGNSDSPDYLEGMEVYNFIFNIFPMKMRGYDAAAIILRKKNYYAPEEQRLIQAFHKQEPKQTHEYHFIHWRKAYFSTYNCFELSNISDRSLFKSKVDFLIAIEYNKDTHYFSNITEAWTRDLHCFIVQANSSDYGDTKVVQPTKSVNMDVMKIKGGDFPLVMVTTLKINDLRQFHRLSVQGQMSDKSYPYFKPTPACYEWKWAERRIKNYTPSLNWFEKDDQKSETK